MEVLAFELVGKFAHFRKFYGNNTALSYSIPPRTTINGILAAILGMPKDSYYEHFNSNNLDIGIFLSTQIKKYFHRINTLMIKDLNDFDGRKGHTQTPFEIISGYNLKKDVIRYVIYLHNKNFEFYEELKNKIINKKSVFSLSLGLANFLAWIENPIILEAKKKYVDNQEIIFHSAVNSETVLQINLENNYLIEQERLPADFSKDRKTTKFNDVVFAVDGKTITAAITGEYYQLGNGKNIQFLN